jgi:starch-binding outer membrane protein, SusD/RagB family
MSKIISYQPAKANRIFLFYLLIISGISFTGCEDFYIPPKNEYPGEDVAKTTLSLDLVMNGAYGPIGRFHSSDYMVISELFGGHSLIYQETGSRNQNYVNMRNFDLSPSTGLTNNAWVECYKSINSANVVIEAINSIVNPIDDFYEAQKDRLLGEAYFIRALGHFNLVKLYGTQYSEATMHMPGIILRTSSSTGENFNGRSTVKDAYDLIISDLKAATTLLPVNYSGQAHGNFPAYMLRAKRKAASALLAKVYFQMNDLDNALAQINRTIGDVPGDIVAVSDITGNAVPRLERTARYTNMFTKRSKDMPVNEVLFNFNNSLPEADHSTGIRTAIFNNFQAYFQGVYHYSVPMLLDLFNYSDDYGTFDANSDVRYINFVDTVTQRNGQDTLLHSAKYGFLGPNAPLENATFLNIALIRSVELLLIRAEINALKGDLTSAQLDLNAVTTRAGIGQISDPLSYKELMSRIMVERLKELDLEGDVYWHWKRMGAYSDQSKYADVKYAYKPIVRNGQQINWDSSKTLAKIPEDEMNRNPDIRGQQNP